jgi:hypothetical protein
MNELQIKLTADIKDIQSALTKVKKTLKEFEDSASSSTDKTNKKQSNQVGIIQKLNAELSKYKTLITKATSEAEIAKYNAELQKTQKELARLNALGKVFEQRKVVVKEEIGLIGQLNAQVKQLKVSLQQATSEQEVERLNAELAQTSAELARLNALGKSFANPAVKSFNNLKSSVGAANGSAIAFNRIIQDAPFGLLGVGNNIQQFTEQIAFLKQTTGSTGAALKSFFSSLITPTNLLILGVSALTAGLTAYQMGAFDSAEETKDLAKELEDFKNSLDGVSKAQLEGTQNAKKQIQEFELLRLQAENLALSDQKRLLAVKKLKEEFPDLLKGYTDEEILLGKVGKAYEELTKQITAKALASAFSSQTAENAVKSATLEFQEQKRGLEILKETAELNKLIGDRRRAEQGGQFGAGQNVAISNDILEKQKQINDLEEKNKESKKTRNELTDENLFLQKKVSEQIAKAGGLLDDEKDKRKDINQTAKELNAEEMFLFDRQLKAQKDRELAEQKAVQYSGEILADYEKLQATLLNTLAALKQNPGFGLNPVFIAAIETKLKSIDGIVGSIASKRKENVLPEIDPSQLTGLELPTKQAPGLVQEFEDEITRLQQLIKVTTDPKLIDDYKEQLSIAQSGLSALLDKNILKVEDLAQAFTGLGSVIGRAFNNPQLGTFLGQFAQFVAKVVAGSFAVAKANAVAGATQSSLFTGPAAAFTLPAFIASSVGLVASAFAALGNFGGGGGGGSTSGGSGSTFTNRREFGGPVSKGRAYIVGERRPELFVPNTNGIIVPQVPSMDYSGASVSSGMYGVEVMLKGPDDLLFFVEQAQVRRNIR